MRQTVVFAGLSAYQFPSSSCSPLGKVLRRLRGTGAVTGPWCLVRVSHLALHPGEVQQFRTRGVKPFASSEGTDYRHSRLVVTIYTKA